MKKTILGFFIMALAVSAGLAAPRPGEKTIQFSLGGNFTMLRATHEDHSYFLAGAALRVDINLGRSFILAPEISGGIGGISWGTTLNFRAGRYFAGAGALAVYGLDDEWGIQTLLKIHVGLKSPRALLAAAFLSNRWFKGFGLTAGYIS